MRTEISFNSQFYSVYRLLYTICLFQVDNVVRDRRDRTPYTEILYAHLLDSDNVRLTYTHFTVKAKTYSLVEITFNRPVYIQKDKVY